MTTLLRAQVGVRARVGGVAVVRDTTLAIQRSLMRYPVRHRACIIGLASRHRHLADLAVTFPGLLFALALSGREGMGPLAIDLAIRGAPLKAVAAAAGIPMWLRRVPTEALHVPIGGLPDSELFRRRIANHLPRSPKLAAGWLVAVRLSAHWCDDDLAIWIAREIMRGSRITKPERLQLLSLYAWYSRRPQAAAHRFIRIPWQPGMRYLHALDEAESWREAVMLALNLANRHLDPWLEPATVSGFEFVPLLSATEIAQEADAMRNCVRRYGYALAHDHERFWSIRSAGERVATVSVGFGPGPILEIRELKGPANAEAPKPVWVAARRWIDQHDLFAIERKREHPEVPFDRKTWIELWRPYWLEKRHIPGWLPLAPTRAALRRLIYWRA
jgi:hypothetical protein